MALDDEMQAASAQLDTAELPEGEYAIVEILGHNTLIGRVTEVERFGTKLVGIEPIFNGRLLPQVLQGGGSIYRFTPCSREVAAARGATSLYQLPSAVRAAMPAELLPAPESTDFDDVAADDLDDDDDGERF